MRGVRVLSILSHVTYPIVTHNLRIIASHFSKQASRLFVSFKFPDVQTIKCVEITTYSDFLAVCGGLLGLFLGVSVLSIVEFLYYSTIHLYWIVRRVRDQNAVVPIKKQFDSSVGIDVHNKRDFIKHNGYQRS